MRPVNLRHQSPLAIPTSQRAPSVFRFISCLEEATLGSPATRLARIQQAAVGTDCGMLQVICCISVRQGISALVRWRLGAEQSVHLPNQLSRMRPSPSRPAELAARPERIIDQRLLLGRVTSLAKQGCPFQRACFYLLVASFLSQFILGPKRSMPAARGLSPTFLFSFIFFLSFSSFCNTPLPDPTTCFARIPLRVSYAVSQSHVSEPICHLPRRDEAASSPRDLHGPRTCGSRSTRPVGSLAHQYPPDANG